MPMLMTWHFNDYYAYYFVLKMHGIKWIVCTGRSKLCEDYHGNGILRYLSINAMMTIK